MSNQQEKTIWQRYQGHKRTTQELGEEARTFLAFIRAIAYLLISVPTLIAEVFLHRRFGARALTLGRCVLALGLLAALPLVFSVSGGGRGVVYVLLVSGALIGMVVHGVLAIRDEQRGVRWHSRCTGVPYSALWKRVPGASTPFRIVHYYEPALLVLIGLIVHLSIGAVGMVIWATGLLLFVKWRMAFNQARDQVRDQIDQQIEGEVITGLVEQKQDADTWDTSGFVVPPAAVEAAVLGASVDEARDKLADRMGAVEPKPGEHEQETVVTGGDNGHVQGGEGNDR